MIEAKRNVSEILRSAPFLWVLAGTIAGIIAGSSVPLVWTGLLILVMILAAIFLWQKGYRMFAPVVISFMCGVTVWNVEELVTHCNVPTDGQQVTARGIITDINEGEFSTRVIVKLTGDFQGNCNLTVVNGGPTMRRGDLLEFVAKFKTPATRHDIDDEDMMERFYFLKKIGAVATVPGNEIIVDNYSKLAWPRRFLRLREQTVDVIASTPLSPVAQGLLSALLVGDDSMLFDGTRQSFAAAGIAHVLALSGLHIAVIAMMLGWILFPLTWLGMPKSRSLAVIALLWFYVALTGLSPSVVRAAIMFSLLILVRFSARRYSSFNVLCFAGFIIAILWPRCIFGAGYQLTMIATASLIIIPKIVTFPDFKHRWQWWISSYLIYTIAAFTGTLLLAIYWFHQAPLLFLLTNLPCTMLLPIIMVIAVIVLILQIMGWQLGFLISVEDFLCRIVEYTASLGGQVPGGTVSQLLLPGWCVWIGYLALIVLLGAFYYRNVTVSCVSLAVLVAVMIIPMFSKYSDTLFVARNPRSTTVVFNDDSGCYAITTAPLTEWDGESDRLLRSYPRYFMKHGGNEALLLNSPGKFSYLVTFGKHELAIVNENSYPDFGRHDIDYLIVGNGFKRDIRELVKVIRCDTVLLGSDIHARRRHRYLKELLEEGQPARDLGESYGLVLR